MFWRFSPQLSCEWCICKNMCKIKRLNLENSNCWIKAKDVQSFKDSKRLLRLDVTNVQGAVKIGWSSVIQRTRLDKQHLTEPTLQSQHDQMRLQDVLVVSGIVVGKYKQSHSTWRPCKWRHASNNTQRRGNFKIRSPGLSHPSMFLHAPLSHGQGLMTRERQSLQQHLLSSRSMADRREDARDWQSSRITPSFWRTIRQSYIRVVTTSLAVVIKGHLERPGDWKTSGEVQHLRLRKPCSAQPPDTWSLTGMQTRRTWHNYPTVVLRYPSRTSPQCRRSTPTKFCASFALMIFKSVPKLSNQDGTDHIMKSQRCR